ncbi:MAG: hypothetical protein II976_09030 [Alistipes sp.]|nr:hypothetical protein [Alistipes sp.]MBQ3583075.1 hypothetical protein [Alistipes sp.]
MSKGNLFLGFGRGSVGDVVLYHKDGEQIARARNRKPANPQTALQLLQRVVLKTSSMAYALMQDICNHSFQGYAEGTECQSRFNKLNIQRFREQLYNEINSGDAGDILGSAEANFSYNGASLVEMNPYRISDGSLKTIPVAWGASIANPCFVIQKDLGSAAPSYNDVLAALSLVSGDQLTFIGLSCDDTDESGQFNGFDYARVILQPATGDLTVPFIVDGAINDANEKNRGDFTFGVAESNGEYYLYFYPTSYSLAAGANNSLAAGAVILSRSNGSIWQRSPQQLVVRSSNVSVNGHLLNDHDVDYLGDACQSFMSDTSSLLYLNQAGGSGESGRVVVRPRLSGVSIGGTAIARSGLVSLRANTDDLTAIMSGDDGESTFTLALRAVGSSVNFKSQVFTSTSATISNIGIVKDTTYNIVLIQGNEVVDTFAQVIYEDEPESATISSCTVGGASVARGSTTDVLESYGNCTCTMADGVSGKTYTLAIRLSGTTTDYVTATFSDGTANISQMNLNAGNTYTINLLEDGVLIDTFASVHATSFG